MYLVILGISAAVSIAAGAATFSILECRFMKQLVDEREKYWERIKEER